MQLTIKIYVYIIITQKRLNSLEVLLQVIRKLQEPNTSNAAYLSITYGVNNILVILKGTTVNHYIRKTILNGVQFIQVTINC